MLEFFQYLFSMDPAVRANAPASVILFIGYILPICLIIFGLIYSFTHPDGPTDDRDPD